MYRSRGLETDGAPSPVLPALRRRKADDHLGQSFTCGALVFLGKFLLRGLGAISLRHVALSKKSTLRVLSFCSKSKSTHFCKFHDLSFL